MATIEERKQQLEKKLKKMAEDNVVVKPVTVPNPFDPSEDTEPSLATSREEDKSSEEMKTAKEERTDETGGEEIGNTEPKRERKPRIEKSGRSSLSIEEYRSLYFHPVRSQMRTAFSINLETLQNLRNVLQDLGERVSIASYIDNILREHLREHQELLNNAAAKQRRKTTITLWWKQYFSVLYWYSSSFGWCLVSYISICGTYDFIIKKNGKSDEDIKKKEATKKKDGQKGKGTIEQAEFVLIGKSRSTSPIIPQIPSVSSSENSEQNNNNFAPQNSEKEEEMKEDNEMDVDFEMERVDENEVAREELSLPIESTSGEAEISEQSVLARDLVRLQKWAKNSEEADEGEVKETVLQLQDSDLLDKYKENIAKMLGEQASLLEKIRKAEEKEEQNAQPAMPSSQNSTPPVSGISDTAVGDADDRPLSYYL